MFISMHEYSLRAVIERKWFKIVPIQIPFLHFICMFDASDIKPSSLISNVKIPLSQKKASFEGEGKSGGLTPINIPKLQLFQGSLPPTLHILLLCVFMHMCTCICRTLNLHFLGWKKKRKFRFVKIVVRTRHDFSRPIV